MSGIEIVSLSLAICGGIISVVKFIQERKKVEKRQLHYLKNLTSTTTTVSNTLQAIKKKKSLSDLVQGAVEQLHDALEDIKVNLEAEKLAVESLQDYCVTLTMQLTALSLAIQIEQSQKPGTISKLTSKCVAAIKDLSPNAKVEQLQSLVKKWGKAKPSKQEFFESIQQIKEEVKESVRNSEHKSCSCTIL